MKRLTKRDKIAMCLWCGHRLSLCGKPFTADMPCGHCFFINEFRNSLKPVRGRWWWLGP